MDGSLRTEYLAFAARRVTRLSVSRSARAVRGLLRSPHRLTEEVQVTRSLVVLIAVLALAAPAAAATGTQGASAPTAQEAYYSSYGNPDPLPAPAPPATATGADDPAPGSSSPSAPARWRSCWAPPSW